MSLNKFTNAAKNKLLNFEIGCDKLECDEANVNILDYEGPLFECKLAQHEDVVIENRTDDAPIFDAGAYVGTLDFQAGEMKNGYAFKIFATGNMTALSGSNLTFKIYVGPAVSPIKILEFTTDNFISSSGLWALDVTSVCWLGETLSGDVGVPNMYTVGQFRTSMPNGPTFVSYISGAYSGPFDGVQNDFWDSLQTLDATVKWNNLSVANVFSVEKVLVERIR